MAIFKAASCCMNWNTKEFPTNDTYGLPHFKVNFKLMLLAKHFYGQTIDAILLICLKWNRYMNEILLLDK